MTEADLPEVTAIGRAVHPGLPEDPGVFAERLRLYPPGCLVLLSAGGIAGYAIGHPWRLGPPPKLNTLLLRLPQAPDTFYIHDLALLAPARGAGAGGALVRRLAQRARRAGMSTLSLVGVSGSLGFWRRQGFDAAGDAALQHGLASYGDAARFMVRSV